MALFHQNSNSAVFENSLSHAEAFLIVSSSDLENISSKLLSQNFTWELIAHLLVKQSAAISVIMPSSLLVLVVYGNCFLPSTNWVADVKLRWLLNLFYLHVCGP